jgi:hypothetical protein
MMDELVWMTRLAEINGDAISDIIPDQLACATRWLSEMVDPDSGRVPNYGANDGALLLPLSACDRTDFRPTLQAAHYLLHRERCLAPGSWDEMMLWLFGAKALAADLRSVPRAASFAAPRGGYYVLRSKQSWMMTRCHTYRNRPCQADMLHVDLWHLGRNILRDAGTYKYYCEAPWQHYFLSTAAHNTVSVDQRDQMIKGPRFLWFKWAHARLRYFFTSRDKRMGYFEGEHSGYSHLPGRVFHRRAICRLGDTYLIVDDVLGAGLHEVVARWRLIDSGWQADSQLWRSSTGGINITIGVFAPDLQSDEDSGAATQIDGAESLYYGDLRTATVLERSVEKPLPVRIITVIHLGLPGSISSTSEHVHITSSGEARVFFFLNSPGDNFAPICFEVSQGDKKWCIDSGHNFAI